MSRRSYNKNYSPGRQLATEETSNSNYSNFAPRRANKLKEFFGLNSIQKNLLPRARGGNTSRLSRYIRFNRNIRLVGSLSVIMLMVIGVGVIAPYYIKSNNSEATAGQAIGSTLAFSAESLTASVSLSNLAKDGTFATSAVNEQAKFSIATDNFTGYTLTMRSTSGNTLSGSEGNTDTFTSIANNISASTFSNSTNTTYNNQWGIIPNYYYSNNATIANTDTYLSIPSNESITLDVTSAKNTEAKNYTIGIGARADYANKIDTYSNTFILEYIANPVTYSITYNKNTTDTVNNMPTTNPQTGSTSGGTVNSVNLTSNIPTRTGYTFKGWCSVSTSNDTCSGTIYNDQTVEAGNRIMNYGIDQTIDNTTVTLNAMWSANSYNLAVTIGGSGISNLSFAATGETTQNLTASGTISLKYGLEYTITATFASNYELDTWTEAGGSSFTKSGNTATYRVAANNDGTMSISGKSSIQTVTFTAGSNIDLIMVADGSNNYKPQYATSGGSTSVTAAPGTTLVVTVVPKANYKLSSWSGTTTGLASTSLLTTTYTMPSSSNTLTAVGASGTYTTMKDFSACSEAGNNVTDERNGISYTVAKIDSYCYMLSNLRLAGGTTLSTSTSHVSSSYTLPSDTGNSGWTNDYCKPYMATKNNEYYYNWPAATARTNSTSNTSSGCSNDRANSVGNICPYSWSLPNSSDITSTNAWNNGTNPAMLSTTGYFNFGSQGSVGSSGLWWSSTRGDNYAAYYLRFDGTSANRTNFEKSSGYSVRCMRKIPEMQNVTPATLVALLPNNGDTAPFTDNRDGTVYTIGKLNDKYWMLDNLRLGGSSAMTLTGENTNLATTSTTYTLPASGKVCFASSDCTGTDGTTTGTGYTVAAINANYKTTTSANNTDFAYNSNGDVSRAGVYYNYCAASAGTICDAADSNNNNAQYDICPKGWRLPTGGYDANTSEFRALANNLGNVTSGNLTGDAYTNFKAAFHAGLSGIFYNGSVQNQASGVVFWSSTRYSGKGMYRLGPNTTTVFPQGSDDRYNGNSVRCVYGG